MPSEQWTCPKSTSSLLGSSSTNSWEVRNYLRRYSPSDNNQGMEWHQICTCGFLERLGKMQLLHRAEENHRKMPQWEAERKTFFQGSLSASPETCKNWKTDESPNRLQKYGKDWIAIPDAVQVCSLYQQIKRGHEELHRLRLHLILDNSIFPFKNN